ncbi:UNVERIFIED_CONTAM: hypothetical protein FKN15_037250 [Acipenser sinensis]
MGVLRSFTFSLLLCGLIGNTTCSCNVTECFTDYISSLSCFCTGALPSFQYELLTQWDNYLWHSSCKLEPVESDSVARHWCVLIMEDLLTNPNYTVCVRKVSSEPEEERTGCAYVSIAENSKSRLRYEIYTVMALVVLLAVGLSVGIRTNQIERSWVGPAYTFSAFDFAENRAVPVVNVQQDFQKKLCEIEEDSGKHSEEQGRSRDSKLYFSSGSVTTDQRDKSTGHVSIDTVTVSDEDGLCCHESEQEDYRAGRGSDISLDYPSAGDLDSSSSSEEDSLLGSRRGGVVISSGCLSVDQGRSHEAMKSMQSPTLGQLFHSHDWDPEPGNLYPQRDAERLSLDSFASNVRSEEEYGYPRIDLDTIDSGFVESDCSSPVESNFDSKGQVSCPILSDEDHSTNYVKQWVAYAAATSDEGCSSS